MNILKTIDCLKNKILGISNKINENKQKLFEIESIANDNSIKIENIIESNNKILKKVYDDEKEYNINITGGTITKNNYNYTTNGLDKSFVTNNLITIVPSKCSIYGNNQEKSNYNETTKKYDYSIKISNDSKSKTYDYSLSAPLHYASKTCKDEIDMINNNSIRRVAFIEFKGEDSEGWTINTVNGHKNTLFFKSGKISNNIVLPQADTETTQDVYCNVICSKIRYLGIPLQDLWTHDIEGVSLGKDGCLRVSIKASQLESADLTGFLKWLKAGNLKIGCTKITPTEYSLTTDYNIELYDNSTIEIVNDNTTEIKVQYSYGVFQALKELENKLDKLNESKSV